MKKLKINKITMLIVPVITYLLWYFCYPETLATIEANSYFVTTPDYLNMKFSQPGGTGWLLGDFISQFYQWREIGALIFALLTLLIEWSSYRIALKLSEESASLSGAIISMVFAIATLSGLTITSALQIILFVIGLAFYISINNNRIRYATGFALIPLWAMLLPNGMSTLFFIWCAAIEYLYYKSGRLTAIPIIYGIISLLVPFAWTWAITFVPSELNEAFVSYPSTKWISIAFVIGLLPALWLISLIHINKRWIPNICILLLGIILIPVFSMDKKAQKDERHHLMYALASIGDWNNIASNISIEEAKADAVAEHYLLLAYSELGVLPDKIPDLEPTSTNCFYFKNSNNVEEREFNSLFYAALGLYNESIHQTFERAMQSENGMTFRSLRNMIDWALKQGDIAISEKYITVLQHSSCHSAWITKRVELLSYLKKKNIEKPDRYPIPVFLGSQSFVTEMGQLVNWDSKNLKKIDYLLCGLLIEKNLPQFKALISALHYDKLRNNIPQCYQYALQ